MNEFGFLDGFRSAALAALTVGALLGCQGSAPSPATAGERQSSVLLVTIDTLRADHLGFHGARDVETDTLDRLAAEGTSFVAAYAVAPLTLPSHATILTGLLPPEHGVRHNGYYRLDPSFVTLAERLQESGLRTGAFVGAFVLDGRFGLDQGFETYDDDVPRNATVGGRHERRGDEVTDRAIAWLNDTRAPFFLWVHYFDPHASYPPPSPYAERFADRPYDGEIAFVDDEIDRLLDVLESTDRLQDTLLVVTSDHGESLGEHNEGNHSYTLYDATLAVPLIFRGAGIPAGNVVDEVVSIAGVAPTVLSILGLPPPADGDGQDLSALWTGPTDGEPATAYAETLATRIDHGWAPLHALRSERYLYVRAPRPELYDTAADPGQVRNLLEDDTPANGESVVGAMERSLDEILAAEVEDRVSTTDAETLERLRALGYALPAGQVEQTGTDPKDGIRWSVEFDAAVDRYEAGDPAARQTLIELEDRLPESGSLRRILVEIAITDGDFGTALTHAEKAVELIPMSAYDLMMLGFVKERLGDVEGAVASYREAALFDPDYDRIQLGLMTGALMEGRYEEALERERHLRRLLAQGERRVRLWEIGERWQMVGQYEKAYAVYREAMPLSPESERLHMLHAIVLVRLGKGAEAPEHLEKAGALRSNPNLADLLGLAYASTGELETAERVFREVLAETPGYEPARRHLSRLLGMQGRAAEAEGLATGSP